MHTDNIKNESQELFALSVITPSVVAEAVTFQPSALELYWRILEFYLQVVLRR